MKKIKPTTLTDYEYNQAKRSQRKGIKWMRDNKRNRNLNIDTSVTHGSVIKHDLEAMYWDGVV